MSVVVNLTTESAEEHRENTENKTADNLATLLVKLSIG